MKKTLSFIILMAMAIAIVLTSTVFAAGEGSITLTGVSADSTYEIYKLLDLESYDKDSKVYSYTVNSDWTAFFATAEAKAYFSVDAQNYATWIAAEDDATVAEFAKKALAYAKANGIAPVKSSKNAGDFVITGTSGKFAGLELGYYLVDSTVGALCGLTTTNPDASIVAKNERPTIDKQVMEDSTNNWGDTNTADIGQTIYFRTTINVHAGAENYVLHDTMSKGLTYLGVSKIEHIIPDVSTTTVPGEYYEVVTTGLTDGCTFEVVFSNEFTNHISKNDKVIVYYEAMLNRNAIVASDGNPNEAKLDYGEGNTTTSDKTNTYTFGFDIVKTDSQNTLLDGAGFKVYDALTGGNEVKVVLMEDGETYRRAREDETGVEIVVKDGKVRIVGFDNGTYYLEETTTPSGYNQLAARHKFVIADSNLDAVFSGSIFSTGSGVHVVNKAGSMLPETGGLGTTIFVVLGGFAVLAAGVVLFAKKRLSQIAE